LDGDVKSPLQGGEEDAEFAEDSGFVGEEDVVVGVGDSDNEGGWYGFLECGYLRLGQRSQSGGVGFCGLADFGVGAVSAHGPRSWGMAKMARAGAGIAVNFL
jgi:hypothetical protein